MGNHFINFSFVKHYELFPPPYTSMSATFIIIIAKKFKKNFPNTSSLFRHEKSAIKNTKYNTFHKTIQI